MIHPFKFFHSENLKHLSEHVQTLVKGRLWLKIIIGMILGIIVGILLNPPTGLVGQATGELIGNWLALPGHLFLTLIQMIVIPLIFASIIRGIAASENASQLKKMGSRLVFYFLITTITAVTIGITLTLVIKPGTYVDTSVFQEEFSQVKIDEDKLNKEVIDLKDLPSTIISILPENPLNDMVQTQMLQIVIFSLIVGVALVSIDPQKSRPLLNLLNSIQTVCMTIVRWAMLLAPLAVFGLIAQITIKTGFASFLSIAYYIGTVVLGLLIMILIYLLIVFLFGGFTPGNFIKSIKEAQLLAFSTNSSIITMPLTIKIAEEKLNIRSPISNFIIPIGATVNMDGTALYQGVATIFLAQIFGIQLTLGAILVLVITAVGASIGTPATPGVGIVILATVLTSVGIPMEGLVLIIGVDRILEMLRTTTNVTGDLAASVVMNRIIKPISLPVKVLTS